MDSNTGVTGPRLAQNSRYNEPIWDDGDGVSGRSRAWGDVDAAGRQHVMQTIVSEAFEEGFSATETAFALAVARTESGFNPDAAATSSSASGIGQFIDKTGATYGLDDENRFELKANVKAMLQHLKDLFRSISKMNVGSETAKFQTTYALYHDGPSLRFGGKDIARESVLPWIPRFLAFVTEQTQSKVL